MYVYQYRAYLCRQDKTIIAELTFSDLNYQTFLTEFDELEITIQGNQNGTLRVEDANFDLSSGLYLVLLEKYTDDTLNSSQYFTIVSNSISYDSGVSQNKLSCYSAEYIPMTRRKIRGYSVESGTLSQVLNYISATPLYGTWTIGTLPSIATTEYHILEFQDTSIWDAMQSLSTDFDVIFSFDTVNDVISATRRADFTTIKGLVFSTDNFVNSISYQPKYDQTITRLWAFGSGGAGFSRYNKFGVDYIDSMDYPIAQGWFSSSLLSAWNVFVAKANGYTSAFNTLVGNWETYSNDLINLEGELAVLQTQNAIYETQMSAYKNAYPNESAVPGSAYSTVWALNDTLLGTIASKEAAILAKEGQITSAENSMTAIAADLAYTNPINFTTAQLKELSRFIQEDTINMESLDDGALLLQYAQTYLARKNVPIIEVSVDSVDLFSNEIAYAERAKIQNGTYIYFDIPSIGFVYNTLQLVGWSHNPFDNKLSLTYSNSNKVESDIYYVNDVFKKANATSTKVTNNITDWSSYVYDKPDLLSNTSAIDAENNEITAGEITINRWGFRGTDIGAGASLEYQKDKIVALRNDGENFDTLLSSNGLALYNSTRTSRTIITPGDAYGKFGGIQIDKWETAATPNEWSGQFWADTNGDLHMTGELFIGNDTSRIVIDRNGLDPTYAIWYKNLLPNTGMQIAETPPIATYDAEFTPWQWTGAVSSVSSSFREGRSAKIAYNDTLKSVPAFEAAKCNPTYFPTGTKYMRFSWWSKLGQASVRIKDETNSNYFSIAQASTPITVGTTTQVFARRDNWYDQPDSLWFDLTESGHTSCADIRVEIQNVYSGESLYINAPQLTLDKTGKWPQAYIQGPFSVATADGSTVEGGGLDPSGGGGTIGNLYVETAFPTNAANKAVLVDTDDYSRYDKKTISTATSLSYGDNEYLNVSGTTTVTLFSAATVETEGAGKVAVFFIKNIGTDLVTVAGTIDGLSAWYIYPGEQYEFYSAGTEWKVG